MPLANPASESLPHVVIVGGGFAGLSAAQSLAGAPARVTLLDRKNHHCFQPLLYQVATAALSPADVAWPIRRILRGARNTTVLLAEVHGVDPAAHQVFTDSVTLTYDVLVLATGATYTYFGHQEWAPLAPGLKTIEDATLIRRRLLLAFERAELAADEVDRRRLLTFVIVGGGPTGVELAGAIAEVARETLPRDFRRIDPRAARVVLVEAGPRLLPPFPERLAAYAASALQQRGVQVITGTAVRRCAPDGVDLADGRHVEAGTIVWAAGVVASPASSWLGAAHDRAGRVQVAADLSLPGQPDIFVIGDTATVPGPDGRPVPGLAPAAKQMGQYVGKTIAARLRHARPPGPFRYRHQGDLATIGRRAAVVQFGRLSLKGALAWVFWSIAHIYFLISLRYRFVVAFTWLWDYVTYGRGARLITQSAPDDSEPDRLTHPAASAQAAARSDRPPSDSLRH